MVKRCDIGVVCDSFCEGKAQECEALDGDYVTHKDYERDIKAKEVEIERLRGALSSLVAECENPMDDGSAYDDCLAYAKEVLTNG